MSLIFRYKGSESTKQIVLPKFTNEMNCNTNQSNPNYDVNDKQKCPNCKEFFHKFTKFSSGNVPMHKFQKAQMRYHPKKHIEPTLQ